MHKLLFHIACAVFAILIGVELAFAQEAVTIDISPDPTGVTVRYSGFGPGHHATHVDINVHWADGTSTNTHIDSKEFDGDSLTMRVSGRCPVWVQVHGTNYHWEGQACGATPTSSPDSTAVPTSSPDSTAVPTSSPDSTAVPTSPALPTSALPSESPPCVPGPGEYRTDDGQCVPNTLATKPAVDLVARYFCAENGAYSAEIIERNKEGITAGVIITNRTTGQVIFQWAESSGAALVYPVLPIGAGAEAYQVIVTVRNGAGETTDRTLDIWNQAGDRCDALAVAAPADVVAGAASGPQAADESGAAAGAASGPQPGDESGVVAGAQAAAAGPGGSEQPGVAQPAGGSRGIAPRPASLPRTGEPVADSTSLLALVAVMVAAGLGIRRMAVVRHA